MIPQTGVAGPIGSPALVLVHGSCVTWRKWREPMDDLARHYRVIAPDLPGHGSRAAERCELDAAVAVVRDALDAQEVRRAVLVGSSLGGYVAMAFADRYPERVAGLVISGATMNFTGAMAPYMRFVGRLLSSRILQPLVGRMTWRQVRAMFANRPPAVRDEQEAAGVFPKGAGESFVALAGRDFSAMLRRYPGPVAIINGERDAANRRSQDRFAAGHSRVTSVVIARAGHSCSVEQPEAFAGALREFLLAIGW